MATHDTKVSSSLVGAIVLFCAAVIALVSANSSIGPLYHHFWRLIHVLPFGLTVTAQAFVDKGLMAFFFLAVGLELKRELTHGALRHPRAMALPLIAAVGGMILPALIYHATNPDGPAVTGWGVPMSTDVAFAAGALVMLGRRAPRNLMIFLLALAIVDDVGAIVIIAFYYTRQLHPLALLWVFLVAVGLVALNLRRVRGLSPYLGLGAILWWALWQAGVDAPLAGVLVAATIPASEPQSSDPGPRTAADRLERRLGPYVTFGVMPLFALANAGLVFSIHDFTRHISIVLGVLLGLVLGKFVGVGGASWLALRFRLVRLPTDVTFPHILGAAWLSGIGFTMALFINTLAFALGPERAAGKLAVLIASPLAGALGVVWLWRIASRPKPADALSEKA